VYIHYLKFSRKFDCWVNLSENRIQKAWRLGQPFQLNNRIDCKDEHGQWLEARVIELEPDRIKVHYRKWHSRFDAWIPKNSSRIVELGTNSGTRGVGRRVVVKNLNRPDPS
jgi:hypothetical protein